MARYSIEVLVIEIDEVGDEVQIEGIFAPTVTIEEREVLLGVARAFVQASNHVLKGYPSAKAYYPTERV